VGPPAPGALGRARPRWKDRLVRGGGGLVPRSRPFGGLHTGPSPVDRARAGSKHLVLTDSRGLPLAVAVTGGHRNNVTQLIPLVDAMASMEARDGWPRAKPERIVADRGYDHDKHRTLVASVGSSRSSHGDGPNTAPVSARSDG
jgi:DDE family transposase